MALSIALGIFFGLLASFVQSLGLTIQRKSHVLNQSLPEHQQRLEYKRPLWLLGFAIFISSNIIGSLVQIASLPVVILAPLGAVSLLWNAFFARILLGDVFSAWMILGTLFIAGGAVLIAYFGILPEPTRSLEDLLELLRRPTFVVYFSLLGAVVFICLAMTHFTEFRLSKRLAVADPIPSPVRTDNDPTTLATGITDVAEMVATEHTPLLDSRPKDGSRRSSMSSGGKFTSDSDSSLRSIIRTHILLAISYASVSGILSGMCLLFAKSGVMLLLLTIGGDNQFWRWQSWVLLLALVVFALLQLWYLHKGLVLADPTLVCPSAFCFYNLSSIVNGLIYFDQFSQISPLHLVLVCLGIIILLAGVWIVSIQAGGGGVDFAAWSNEDEISVDIEEDSLAEVTASPDTVPRRIMSDDEDNLEWGTRSEPLMVASPESSTSPLERIRSPESIPTYQSSTRSQRQRPNTEISSRHRRTSTFSHYNPHNTYTQRAPLSPTLPTVSTLAGTGFQIGLSPVSPGFTIVPLERRRRTSNLGMGLPPGISGEGRRTVSEGDMRQLMEGNQGQGTSQEGTNNGLDDPGKGSKSKWSWLRVFSSGTRG